MYGQNPIRPPEMTDGSLLLVQGIFLTLQGEGPLTGTPSVFIRLGGCNLACDFCDTEFESFHPMSLEEIISQTHALAGAARLAVITGGEPLRQNIIPLCARLLESGFAVQIETNGTLWRELPESVTIVCSPKNTQGRYAPLRPDVLARVDALKFIVSATHPHYQNVDDIGQTDRNIPVYIQPMDEYDAAKNQANAAHAMALAQTHNYRLSWQMHKVWGIA